jgi:G-protein coupled receptor 98
MIGILLHVIGGAEATGLVNGFFSFVDTRVVVEEGSRFTTARLQVQRTSGTTGSVSVYAEILNATYSDDFFGGSASVVFQDGQTMNHVDFFVNPDDFSEGNETYLVQILSITNGGEISTPNVAEIVISANDQPFGVVTFDVSSRAVQANELDSSTQEVELVVQRMPGMFGSIVVDWEFVDGPALGVEDFTSTSGQVSLADGQGRVSLYLYVTSDQLPENDEVFEIRLTQVAGGATLGPVDERTANVTISSNDAPLRFSQSEIQASESVGTLAVTVTRGMLADGSSVGPTSVETTVNYTITANSAVEGVDYTGTGGVLTFPSGSTSQTISIQIINDGDPEGDETFTISLSNASSDAVIVAFSTVTVVIGVNDDAGGLVSFSADPVPIVNEDVVNSSVSLTLIRTVASLGDLELEWVVLDSGNQLASEDFNPPNGTVTILDGQTSAQLVISLVTDTVPETPEQFMVELRGVVSGGGRINETGIRVKMVTVADSDDAYGRVEWGTDDVLQVTADPRQLQLQVARSGGLFGSISVGYRVLYLPPGETDPARGQSNVVSSSSGSVQMGPNQSTSSLVLNISSSAILEPSSNFYVNITEVMLTETNPLLSSEELFSPRIGARSPVYVPVPISVSNGLIGFEISNISVMEPADGDLTEFSLNISRTGTFGTASLLYAVSRISSSFDPNSEVTPNRAMVVIPDGETWVTLTLYINPDSIPELDELFEVELLQVTENNQALDPTASSVNVTVLKNDNPEGMFSFDSSSAGPFFVMESIDAEISLTVIRTGGDLTTETISHVSSPSLQREILAADGFVVFGPGERNKTFTIVPRQEDIPELNETIVIELFDAANTKQLIASPSSVDVTVLENDDPYGVFKFVTSSLSVAIDEVPNGGDTSTGTGTYTAQLTIQRDAGTFGRVTVTWSANSTGNVSADISPSSGQVEFAVGQTSAVIAITTVDDQITEQSEPFTVSLVAASNGGRVAAVDTTSTLTVNQNDDPISVQTVAPAGEEGGVVSVTISRGGRANGIAEVSFSLVADSAAPEDYTLMTQSPIILLDGDTEAEVNITIVDDNMPEEEEVFQLQLSSTTGDAVISSVDTSTVIIRANDDHRGVFSFNETSRTLTATEGNMYNLSIVRDRGDFEQVTVLWEITTMLLSGASNDSSLDFMATSGSVLFQEGVREGYITLNVLVDGDPELDEVFIVSLTGVTGGRLDSDPSALLSTVTVRENESPYGLLQFDSLSRELDVAEDVPEGNNTADSATLVIERTRGLYGTISALIEIYPANRAPASSVFDLLLRGSRGDGINTVMPRNNTGTWNLNFASTSVVTVSSNFIPEAERINDGFTISLWLQPDSNSNGGFLVAKVKDGELLYGLELRTLFQIVFVYRPSDSSSVTVELSVQINLSDLLNSESHHLAAAVNDSHVAFYLDGSLRGTRALSGGGLSDEGGGVIYVGGWDGSYYEGDLQDVRIYLDSLSERAVQWIAGDLAASDLSPISFYITMAPDVTNSTISTSSLHDQIPEPPEAFSISITDASSGGEIKDDGNEEAMLTVLKSDYSNGVFGFDGPEFSLSRNESSPVSLRVTRGRGLFGQVTVTWEVRDRTTQELAVSDFDQASGSFVFEPMENEKILYLNITDDSVPELSEEFSITLTTVQVSGTDKLTTNDSGAVINSTASSVDITIEENDDPYGLLQFWTQVPVPAPGDPTTPPLASEPSILITEESGNVTLTVVRAQGLTGAVSVEYVTVDGNATESNDFVSTAGRLNFADGERVRTIVVGILDDSVPELQKQFFVELQNPTGNPSPPSLGVGSRISVNIEPSDDAYGIFSFALGSISVVTMEGVDDLTLNVTRSGGSLSAVIVNWVVGGNASDDVVPGSGSIVFGEGVTVEGIELSIVNDMMAEFSESFTVTLTQVSDGQLDSSNTIATVTVEANDDPYGAFAFSPASQPVRVQEDAGVAMVTIIRQFGVTGRVEVSYRTLSSSNLPADLRAQHQTNSSIASDLADFTPISNGAVTFEEGETVKTFNVTIVNDNFPEIEESLYLQLTNARLISSPVPGDSSLQPTVIETSRIAEVIIEENDDARGVVTLEQSAVNVTEPPESSFLYVVRSAGRFGDITVHFTVIPRTATTADYAPTVGTVAMTANQARVAVPLIIIDDSVPEFDESFAVELTMVTSGAMLGTDTRSEVTILSNDDPNGRFVFSMGSASQVLTEPQSGSTLVQLVIEREGGDDGVVQVQWMVRLSNGNDASADITPTSGTLQFLTGATEHTLELNLLADDVPEEAEVIEVELVNPTGGAVTGALSVAEIRVLANDEPYGVLEFSSNRTDVNETDSLLPVQRRRGTFGTLRIQYAVELISVSQLATDGGIPATDYFATVPGTNLPSEVVYSSLPTTTGTPLTECAESCISDRACRSFNIDTRIPPNCRLSSSTSTSGIRQPGAFVYDKLVNRVRPFEEAQASTADFTPVASDTITIAEGDSVGYIPLSITDDTIPELTETFIVYLRSVELTSGASQDSTEAPYLGSPDTTWVSIVTNDDPFGRFYISITTNTGSASSVSVPETENFAVSLTVERRGGSMGTVEVALSTAGSTATAGVDYTSLGNLLTFAAGELSKSLVLEILPDNDPERDETILLTLVNATMGSNVAEGEERRVRIVIEANDNAAGIVRVAAESRAAVVQEGDSVVLLAERVVGMEGEVEVDWVISGTNAAQDFQNSTGTAVFEDGSSTANISFSVASDLLPEVDEVFTLTLYNVRTISADVAPTGHATLGTMGVTATITIAASNNAHGVFEFRESAVLNVMEGVTMEVTIAREFGTFGEVVVTYQAVVGGPFPASTDDIISTPLNVTFADGEAVKTITVPVVDDSIPELVETFYLLLISAQLVGDSSSSSPSIGASRNLTIGILENDNPYGVLVFENTTLVVEEASRTVMLRVLREAGTVGSVVVNVFDVPLTASKGVSGDYDFVFTTLTFAENETEKSVSFTIFDDSIPEDNEDFQLRLDGVVGDAVLGNGSTITVTIAVSEDGHGVFSFDSDSLSQELNESGTIVSNDNIARLTVVRNGGLFQEVIVPYEVDMSGRRDLTPPTGRIVFSAGQNESTFDLTAVLDNEPELTETFTVTLLEPSLGRLDTQNIVSQITIESNEFPFGRFELVVRSDPMSSTVTVEEGVGSVEVEVQRTFGSFGTATVEWSAMGSSATDNTAGLDPYLATFQKISDIVDAGEWLFFTHGNSSRYLLLLSTATSGTSKLYLWKGTFVHVQDLSTNGASAADAYTTSDGRTLVAIANGGSDGNRVVNSNVYEVRNSQLVQIQSVQTSGANDVLFFEAPNSEGQNSVNLFFANNEDNAGSLELNSPVLQWNGSAFTDIQSLSLRSPSAAVVFQNGSDLFMVVVSVNDDRSSLYSWSSNRFTVTSFFATSSASDAVHYQGSDGSQNVVVASSDGTAVFTLSGTSLTPTSTISGSSTADLETFVWNNTVNLVLVQPSGSSAWYVLQSNGTFLRHSSFNLPAASKAATFTTTGGTNYIALSASENILYRETVYDAASTDFISNGGTLLFNEGESSQTLYIDVINDADPELDEMFQLQLTNPTGGSVLGSQGAIDVVIATNDNAYGIIGFAEGSRSTVLPEGTADTTVSLVVERLQGTEGLVEVGWELQGDHDLVDIRPLSGTVQFPDGSVNGTITLFIAADSIPELDEVTRVVLTRVVQSGVLAGGDTTRGAVISSTSNTAVITVPANDNPYGVFTWSAPSISVEEPADGTSPLEFTIVRQSGSVGFVEVTYSTAMRTDGQEYNRATAGVDYESTSGTIVIGNGVTSGSIPVNLISDTLPEDNEDFYINIDSVRLLNQTSSISTATAVVGNPRLTVTISANDDANGVVEFNVTLAQDGTVQVEETSSSLQLELIRRFGTFGQVSVTFMVTGISASGNGVDFRPDSGIVTFENLMNSVSIPITIVNDVDPELDETFSVELVSVNGGARLGSDVTTTVTILRSDDVNGIFQFSGTTVVILSESTTPDDPDGVAEFTVTRSRGSTGDVVVYWEVGPNAADDLAPINGTLFFGDGETMKTLSIRVLRDGAAESFETFTVTLVSATNGGRVFGTSQANIGVLASDDPSGLIAFASYPNGIVASEGDEIVVRLFRSGGTFGTAIVTWEITPADSNTFASSTGGVVFGDGNTTASIVIQVPDDSTPEVATKHQLVLVTAGQARIDFNASTVDIFVRASDYPHGRVQFNGPVQVPVDETVGVVNVPVQREFGSVGMLRVNFTSIDSSAVRSEDYSIQSYSVTLGSSVVSQDIPVTIIDDTDPEIAQAFQLQLQSVELLNEPNFGRDFVYTGPESLDQEPELGGSRLVEIIINENDDARGVISFSSSVYRVSEGAVAYINITRMGGTFGTVGVDYEVISGSAVVGEDIRSSTGIQTVLLQSGQSSTAIAIQITDDSTPELQEQFTIQLLDADNGASLGDTTVATVIISSSDAPSGVIAFGNAEIQGIRVTNPSTADGAQQVTLQVVRTGSLTGAVQVQWQVVGPDPGNEAVDISQSTLQGILSFTNGQSSAAIRIWVLASDDDEPEEVFLVRFVAASGGAVFDADSPGRIIVSQQGMPFGMVGFAGEALDPRVFVEGTFNAEVYFPVSRTGGNLGNIQVFFAVSAISGSLSDVTPVTGSVNLTSGVSRVNITLTIVPDDLSELEESFEVTVTRVDGGAGLDQARLTSAFSIRANDVPYGEFAVSRASVVRVSALTTSRNLQFTVLRQLGTFGRVRCTISSVYNQNSSLPFVTSPYMVNFEEGVTEEQVSLPINSAAFLASGRSAAVSITSVELLSDGDATTSPVISSSGNTTLAVISDDVANPLVSFAQQSLETSVTPGVQAGNVELNLVKSGRLGDVIVTWVTGLSPSESQPGLVNGSLSPSTGSVSMTVNQSLATFTLTASPASPHGTREIFIVNLQVQSSAGVVAEVDSTAGMAIVEPYGVVEAAMASVNVLEGTNAEIVVWRRFGSQGNIRVTGVASIASASLAPSEGVAATPSTDFSTQSVSVDMSDGITTATLSVPIPDNSQEDRIRIFWFNITDVRRVSSPSGLFDSPRLNLDSVSTLVSIIDDEGGSGIFQFSRTTPLRIGEDGNVTLTVTIVRAVSTVGTVRIQVMSVGDEAIGGEDYVNVNRILTFENGVGHQDISVVVLDDSVPELAESFELRLMDLYNEAVIQPSASSLEVVINENDNALGVFTMSQTQYTLNDADQTSTTVTILRRGGTLNSVTLEWSITVTDSNINLGELLVQSQDRITFAAGQTTGSFTLQLNPVNAPQAETALTLTLTSLTLGALAGTAATVTIAPCSRPVYSFASSSMFVITEVGSSSASVTIQRIKCRFITDSVRVLTTSPATPVQVGRISVNPAMPQVDYSQPAEEVQFSEGATERTVLIPILHNQFFEERLFYAAISSPSPGMVEGGVATIIISPQGQRAQLLPLYIQTLNTTVTIAKLEEIATGLLTAIRPPNTISPTEGTIEIIKLILEYISDTVVSQRLSYSILLRDTTLEIYQVLMENSALRSVLTQFVPLLEDFAYSNLATSPCPGAEPVVLCVRSTAGQGCLVNILVDRSLSSSLVNRRFEFNSSSQDSIVLPSTSIASSAECSNVLFMEYSTDSPFPIEGGTLGNKVLTIGVQGISSIADNQFVTYRIYAPANNRILPQGEQCLHWLGGSWLSHSDNPRCESPQSQILTQNYIECRCSVLGNFSARADISTSYGWFWPAPASCGLVIIIMALATILHIVYYDRLRPATILVVNMFIAIALLEIFALVTMVTSELVNQLGCSILGIILHWTIVTPFSAMAVISVYLWLVFFSPWKNPRPLILFIIFAWAIPLVVVLVCALCVILAGGYPLNEAYGLTLTTATTCYVPHWDIAIGVTITPVVILLLVTFLVFIHASFCFPKWSEAEGIYNYSFNRQDVAVLVIWFVIFTLPWIFAALHAYLGLVELFGFFVAFNILLGLGTIIFYIILAWERLVRRYKKKDIPHENSLALTPPRGTYTLGASPFISSSKQNLVEDDERQQWDNTFGHYTGDPTIPIAIKPKRASRGSSVNSFESSTGGSDQEDSNFNDLMFSLRTGGTYASRNSSHSQHTASERYELRRISIADTHL